MVPAASHRRVVTGWPHRRGQSDLGLWLSPQPLPAARLVGRVEGRGGPMATTTASRSRTATDDQHPPSDAGPGARLTGGLVRAGEDGGGTANSHNGRGEHGPRVGVPAPRDI